MRRHKPVSKQAVGKTGSGQARAQAKQANGLTLLDARGVFGGALALNVGGLGGVGGKGRLRDLDDMVSLL